MEQTPPQAIHSNDQSSFASPLISNDTSMRNPNADIENKISIIPMHVSDTKD